MDIGAAGGVVDHWLDQLPVLTIDCFEPNTIECRSLQEKSPPSVHWFPIALAGSSGTRKFYDLNRATGSSLFPPNDPVIVEFSGHSYAGIRSVVDVECMSASEFLVQHHRPVPELMKLDTQGTELEILSSLNPDQLNQVVCVETEVEFLELYRGQPTFGEVHAFMQSHGFRLLDLRTHRAYRNSSDQPQYYLQQYLHIAAGGRDLSAELVAGDALYIRDLHFQENQVSRLDLIKYLCILRMYRFLDLAYWTIAQAERRGVITPSERDELVRDISYGAPRPRLRQRVDLAGKFTRKLLHTLARDDGQVFWTRRSWPDQ
jgi:FkbM family methyltransferase